MTASCQINQIQLEENVQDQPASNSNNLSRLIEGVFIAGALVIPLYFTLSTAGSSPKRDYPAAQAAVQTINSATQQAATLGGEVLFISQRHLLTFDYVQNVPLVPEDELVFLMEMAMSDNAAYMDAFQADISHQRFAMIVSEPLVIQYQGRSHGFGEENDAWVARVSEPVLCYYEPSIKLDSVGVVLYTPALIHASELVGLHYGQYFYLDGHRRRLTTNRQIFRNVIIHALSRK